ncbi:hypothetical protein GALL_153730 [mine drainage metagenome]|uniref:Uncharacterized protein n=1 Tax=mine drainage metagenome TaxID=410659 RepID=A0A1J5S3R5_9ZZZZ
MNEDSRNSTTGRARLIAVAGSGIALLAIGFGLIPSTIQAPATAVVLVSARLKSYFSPSCLPNPVDEGYTTLSNAKRLGFAPDRKCQAAGGFTQQGRSPIGALVERAGLVKPLPSRWNSGGSWNW